MLLALTTAYHLGSCYQENQQSFPGQLIDIGDLQLHLYQKGLPTPKQPTVVIEHSLGGVEGYLLIDAIAEFAHVCIYDRAGYGWSQHSTSPRTSQEIVQELDRLLTQAQIPPPYLFVGNSFGSYTVRLYAHIFSDKVAGLVLTDGLHELGMLKMPLALKALKWFFTSGFWMSTLGASLGLIRVLENIGLFSLIKPKLKQYPSHQLQPILRSFCRPKHWITMSREIMNLSGSSWQLNAIPDLGDLPIVNIKAAHFFKPTRLSGLLPMGAADALRDKMHHQLRQLSTQCIQRDAHQSSHFVWIDEPELIVNAVRDLLNNPHCPP